MLIHQNTQNEISKLFYFRTTMLRHSSPLLNTLSVSAKNRPSHTPTEPSLDVTIRMMEQRTALVHGATNRRPTAQPDSETGRVSPTSTGETVR